jgi:hypothetical protein
MRVTAMKSIEKIWLPDMDLNHDKQIQSLLCYRYTIGQMAGTQANRFPAQVKPGPWFIEILTPPTDA